MTRSAPSAVGESRRGSTRKRLSLFSLLALAASLLAVVAGASPASADHGASRTTVTAFDRSNGTFFESTYGNEVRFVAQVQDVSASCENVPFDCDPPTGTVAFYADGVLLGTDTTGDPGGRIGFFVLDYCCLPAGHHEIVAQYTPGPPNHFSPSSGRTAIDVNRDDPIVTVAQSSPTTNVGQPVTFTATVTGALTAGSVAPTGTVQFTANGVPLGGPVPLSAVSAGSATASITTSSLSPGTHTISAQYSGDANYLPRAASFSPTHTVQRIATTVSLTSDNNPSTVGEPVTFTAIVNETGSGTPTGTITFRDGATILATVPLEGGFVFASFTTSTLGVGNHSITAAYSGDANFAPSTSPVLTQTVLAHQTTTVLTSSPNPSVPGQPVTFQAVVTTTGPGTPTGTVRFVEGATILGTATLSGGVATFTTSSLGAGTHTITAVYEGDAIHGSSESAPLTQTVVACTVTASSAGGNTLGTPGNDVICGSSANDDIAALGGDDLIVGGGGDDRISAGDGNDTVFGGDGNDQLAGGAGNDRLTGDAGSDAASGGVGTDTCSAEATATCEA